MNIGLTGGMGCGKSTVLQWCREQGFAIFDSDACVRRLLASDRAVHAELEEHFGREVFGTDGGVDRGRLGSIVFENPPSLDVLEQVLHPRVRASWQAELSKPHSCLVVEIPLLFEKNLSSAFDLTCCVVSHPRIQMRRLLARGWSESHIAQRLSRQWTLERKAAGADVVLLNDGTREHLAGQLRHLSRRLGLPGSQP